MSDINERHRDRMARKKAVIDAKIAAADKNIGVLIVNTGPGHEDYIDLRHMALKRLSEL